MGELEESCSALKASMDAVLALHSCNCLDISYGFMSKSTATAVAKTLKAAFQFFRDYLVYIESAHLCDVIVTHCLTDKLVECIFGVITEQSATANPTFMEFARHIGRNCFTYLGSLMSPEEGVSIRRAKDEKQAKYSYSSIESEDASLMWLFYNMQHEAIFNVGDLANARRKNKDQVHPKMLFIGTNSSCQPFTSIVENPVLTDEAKDAIRSVGMALKSRAMKSLRNFQKRKYGTAPTILGFHGSRGCQQVNISELENLQNDPVLEREGSCVQSEIPLYESNAEEECVFAKNDVVLFRGTLGGDFELLEVSNSVPSSNLSEKTKIVGNFLTEISRTGEKVRFRRDPKWIGGSMQFKDAVRNAFNEIVVLQMNRYVTAGGEIFECELALIEDMEVISKTFESELLKNKRSRWKNTIDNERQDQDVMTEDMGEHVEEEECEFVLDKRKRKGRGSRLTEVIEWARW